MRRNEMEMNGTLEQGNECETERSQLNRNIREEERSLPLLYVYILVPYSLYVQRGFREASNGGATTTSYNYGGEHDYYDSAWGCTKTPWWGSGWRPHSPPLEMISVATRSREPQHVSCPSQMNIGRVIIMGEKTFNLTWNNHLANLSGLFEGLYKSGSLTDTTLACQGGMLRAHRLVLAACSPYFERVFKEHYGEQPILILKGVAVEEMECLLDFMYRGSIDVAEEHLPSLIKTATDLEIRGLSGEQRNQENSRSPYTRVETRMQRCHIETRVHTTEYLKEPSVIPFLPKQSSIESLEDHIKVEEIEVEDDPMVIDGHEDTFDEPLRSAETQIRRMPPPMYKRETRFKGQKRVSVGRSTRNNDVLEFRSKERIASKEESTRESYEDSSNTVKSDSNFNNASADPTVPDIQMNDDLQERDESLDSSKSTDDNPRLTIKKKGDCPTKRSGLNEGKDARPMQTNAKAQYKPFSCDLCTLAFTRASHLARHRRVHTGERPFACSICPRMFARQDKLKQHLDSHLQWPKRKNNLSNSSCQSASSVPAKGKRGRPRKQVNLEQSAMEEILKFGEFSSLLNKSHSANATDKNEDFTSVETKIKEQEEDAVEEGNEDKDKDINKDKDNYGCQVENGQDIV